MKKYQSGSLPSSRRKFLFESGSAAAGIATGVAMANVAAAETKTSSPRQPSENKMRYCLNTSTIQGEKIPIWEQVEIAKRAGYDGIEIWLRDVDKFEKDGGKRSDLKKHIADSGLTVESAIAFAAWIIDDDEARRRGLEQAKREMQMVVDLGGKRIAAPPAGASNADSPMISLDDAGLRYRDLLNVGAEIGCVPQIEVWGFSKNLSKLSQVLYVAAAAQHPNACILPDIYHLYKGGSEFEDIKFLAGNKIEVFHLNDYPDIPREKINDSDRVYPGDGIAPVTEVLRRVMATGFNGVLSLELFNRKYWEQDPNVVAAEGLRKMKAVIPT